ncbi:MAG: hypothetical protein EAY69_05500, partial [Cytophagales bacterium]
FVSETLVFSADIKTYTDYYAFGMEMVGRNWSEGEAYRQGYNGKENDKDFGEGVQDYGMRVSDTQTCRFFSVDPITAQYPELTPYQFASNRPIDGIDLDGLEYVKADAFSKTESILGIKTASEIHNEIFLNTLVDRKVYKYKEERYYKLTHHLYKHKDGRIHSFGGGGSVQISEWLYGKINNKIVNFIPYSGNCYGAARDQTILTGATPTEGWEHSIQMYSTFMGAEAGYSYSQKTQQKGEDYIHDAIERGNGILAGVDFIYNNPKKKGRRCVDPDPNTGLEANNNDKTTQHYICISDRGVDEQGRKYLTYYDNAFRNGTSKDPMNRLYKNEKTGFYEGEITGSKYRYRLSVVIPNQDQIKK